MNDLEGLDTRSFVPLYIQLADRLALILRAAGERAIGKVLPAETECAQHLGVSRPTVRQAMDHLVKQGLIVRHRGRGTFVAPAKIQHDMSHSFEHEMRAARRDAQVRLLDWGRITPTDRDRRDFPEIAQFETVWNLRRVRLLDRAPIGIEKRFFPPQLGERISAEDARRRPMFELLRKITGEPRLRLDVELSSRAADAETARLLRIRPGKAVLAKRLVYLAHAEPVSCGTTVFAAEQYQVRFSVELPI